jgi:hypothetical protein
MSSSAQLDPVSDSQDLFAGEASAAELKQFAAERLAAHRSRRALATSTSAAVGEDAAVALEERVPGAARVREAVAARYRQSLSYHEYLASEAERSMQQARAEAEIAARNAEAVEAAQTQLLEELRQWREPAPEPETPAAKLNVRLHEAVALRPVAVEHLTPLPSAPALLPSASRLDPAELAEQVEEIQSLDEEIAFRLDPEFAEHHIEPLPLQANILEFPRQLVAPRKARPRLAEGPLREDTEQNPEYQLRIFEVETELIATAPEPVESASFADAPEWQSLQLDATPAARTAADFVVEDEPAPHEPAAYNPAQSAIYTQPAKNAPLHTARLPRRLLSAAVDGCLLCAAWIGCACLAMFAAGPSLAHLPRPLLGGLAAASLLGLYIVYHLLFFSFADATPGMNYAHLDFCTFANENPTRAALRRRIWATLLAACPLGLGLLWMAMDYDHVGWHDRLSKMYPREY